MTNEELKKKICDIIAPYVSAYGDDERIADALIDANIFVDIDTLKDEQQSVNGILANMSSYMNYKLHELEHRAEVAERALMNMCEEYENYFECDLYKECNSDKPCYLCDYTERLQRAERKLAEENGGKKEV